MSVAVQVFLSQLVTRFLPKRTLFGDDNIETKPNFDFDISLVPFLISCNTPDHECVYF